MNGRDEFYVGYLHPAPPSLGRWLRRFVTAALLVAAFAAGVLVAALRPFDVGALGEVQPYEGVIVLQPYPALIVARPGQPGSLPGWSRYALVGPGKHGADALVGGFAGRAVSLQAAPLYRDGQTLLKVREGSVALLPDDGRSHFDVPALETQPRELRPIEVRGEIVDPQCFLALMKPGFGVPHRACAIRCLAGGVPPVLLSRDAAGGTHYHLLLGARGERINQALLPRVAQPLAVRGTEFAYGELLAIHVAADGLSSPDVRTGG